MFSNQAFTTNAYGGDPMTRTQARIEGPAWSPMTPHAFNICLAPAHWGNSSRSVKSDPLMSSILCFCFARHPSNHLKSLAVKSLGTIRVHLERFNRSTTIAPMRRCEADVEG